MCVAPRIPRHGNLIVRVLIKDLYRIMFKINPLIIISKDRKKNKGISSYLANEMKHFDCEINKINLINT